MEKARAVDLLKRPSFLDHLVYVLCCLTSLGSLWVMRIVITVAIQKAIK